MVKNHIKRIATPKTWKIERKTNKFITRPKAGGHKLSLSLSLTNILRDMISLFKTTKEIKYALNHKEILVNGKKVKEKKYNVGLFDVISIPEIKEHYRILLNKKGKLYAKKIDEKNSKMVPFKVLNKITKSKDKVQLNMSGGKNLTLNLKEAKKYKTGDTLMIQVKDNKILKHFPLEKGAAVYFIEGKHVGNTGIIDHKEEEIYKVKFEKHLILSTKDKFFVLGTTKPELEV